MSGCGGARPKPPRQALKRASNFVIASLKTSTYLAQYAQSFVRCGLDESPFELSPAAIAEHSLLIFAISHPR